MALSFPQIVIVTMTKNWGQNSLDRAAGRAVDQLSKDGLSQLTWCFLVRFTEFRRVTHVGRATSARLRVHVVQQRRYYLVLKRNNRLFSGSLVRCIWFCNKLQWGSEIRTSLDFEWSKRGWVANGPDFERDLKSGSPTIWNRDKWLPFCQKSFEIWTKTAGFQWSCYSPTLWKPDHLKFDLQKVRILNVSRF